MSQILFYFYSAKTIANFALKVALYNKHFHIFCPVFSLGRENILDVSDSLRGDDKNNNNKYFILRG